MMIDLHTHTTFSDGVLIPAELARRAKMAGYRALAFTDHADSSNLKFIIEHLKLMASQYSSHADIDLFVGVELTHIPPALIPQLVGEARAYGAQIVLVHGETIVEPVMTGTNLAAITAGVDILAHPGLITPEEAKLAASKGVHLEISTRKGHSLTNGHVAALAKACGAKLVINNDAHAPSDFVGAELRKRVALGAGLNSEEYLQAEQNSAKFIERLMRL